LESVDWIHLAQDRESVGPYLTQYWTLWPA
jgi:hypothetical protein